jgi:hypothetical protein
VRGVVYFEVAGIVLSVPGPGVVNSGWSVLGMVVVALELGLGNRLF